MAPHTCSDLEIARLTPPGRGALAVVGVRGEGAIDLVARWFTPRGRQPLAKRPDGAIIFGRWGDPERGEELVVVRHAADRLEVHCHGGLAASEAVIASLASSSSFGQSCGEPRCGEPRGETLHAAIEMEARVALARAGGPQAARILCRQLAGALGNELERIAALRSAGDTATATAAVARLRRASRVGLRLVEPWRVVMSGPVNAGKSSLVNALAGYARSIVSAEPGTTRDAVTTRLVLGGWEIDLIDTAGLRQPGAASSATERAGIERAAAVAAEADLVLRINAPAAGVRGQRELLVISKADLEPDGVGPPGVIRTSTHTGEGIEPLAEAIVHSLVPEAGIDPSLLAAAVPFTERQMALIDALDQSS